MDRHHRAPAILTTNGFGGAKDDANQCGIGTGFAKEGYVVLSYSGLGFGGSGCKIYLDNPAYDGKAGKQLVSVLDGAKRAIDAKTGRGVSDQTPGVHKKQWTSFFFAVGIRDGAEGWSVDPARQRGASAALASIFHRGQVTVHLTSG